MVLTEYDLQGLLKLGQSREDKLRRVSLKVDGADITFALQVKESKFLSDKFFTLHIF